ncbi:MAG: hypothetical protein WCJ18_06315 [Planctomycetota bacterium]
MVYDQIVLSNASNLSFSGSNVLSLSFNGAGSLVDWNDSFWDVNRAWTVFDRASGVTAGFSNLSLGGRCSTPTTWRSTVTPAGSSA